MPVRCAWRMSGPSPRGWGNLRRAVNCLAVERAIPTRVGKSLAMSLPGRLTAGHPHAGGEIALLRLLRSVTGGPSPRGWGNPIKFFGAGFCERAIPTRVGKSQNAPTGQPDTAGHPHAGGEIGRIRTEGEQKAGPSPRGWGNRPCLQALAAGRRAIPTRVGKSQLIASNQGIASGHPHAGGEIKRAVERAYETTGPSPRGWGNLEAGLSGDYFHRAIPTRVGKS